MHGTSCRLGEGGGRFQRQGRCDQLSRKHARVTPDTSAYTESPPKSLSWICGPAVGAREGVVKGRKGKSQRRKQRKVTERMGEKTPEMNFWLRPFLHRTLHPPPLAKLRI